MCGLSEGACNLHLCISGSVICLDLGILDLEKLSVQLDAYIMWILLAIHTSNVQEDVAPLSSKSFVKEWRTFTFVQACE